MNDYVIVNRNLRSNRFLSVDITPAQAEAQRSS
jgi:hypothetical protein